MIAIKDPGSEKRRTAIEKIDARGRRSLRRAELPERVEVLLRTRGEPTGGERTTLAECGLDVFSQVGNVLAATALSERLPEVAALDFVDRIEISRALYPEPGGDRRGDSE